MTENDRVKAMADEIRAVAAKRKEKLGLLDWDELAAVPYPTYFTAMFRYSATGEGVTFGILMDRADSVEEIRSAVRLEFGEYYSTGVEIALGLVIFPGLKLYLPKNVRDMIKSINAGHGPMFSYRSQLHYCYS